MLYERRNALRVRLRSYSHLSSESGDHQAHLLNISETGALIAVLDPHKLEPGTNITLMVEVGDAQPMAMEGRIAHIKEHLVGLCCNPCSDADAAMLQNLIEHTDREQQA